MKRIDVSKLVSRIRDELMTSGDMRLLRMALSSDPTQQDLDAFLETWDLEADGACKSLLMSYFMKEHPDLVFPEYFGPRLKGLLSYYRFRNLGLITQYRKIASKLYENGITLTVFKGGAMKHLRPELPRAMSDIDAIVDEADYRKAGRVIADMGYDISWDQHSFDVHTHGDESGILDIHKFIPMLTGHEKGVMGNVRARAKDAVLFGVRGRILSEEDLVFSLLVNMSRNIMNNTSSEGILINFIDIRFLVGSKEGFDWDTVLENARVSKSEKMLHFAVFFVNSVVPGMIPLENTLADARMQEIATMVQYRRYLLQPLQERSHQLGIGTVAGNPRLIPDFIRVRPRYSFLKLFRTRPRIAGKILSLHAMLETI